jgi:hypothetical protein
MSGISAQEAARRLGLLEKEVTRANANAIRRGQTHWRNLTINHFKTRGVGRSIWGKAEARGKNVNKDLRLIVKRMRVRSEGGDSFSGGLTLKGLAAIQEKGGKTAAHTIKAKNAPTLAFLDRSGRLVRPIEVSHPGSNIPAVPSAATTLSAAESKFREEIETGLKKATEKVGLD